LRSTAARVAFVGLLALSPLLIFYASELKQYSTDVFFTLCILVAFSYRSSEHGTALLAATGFIALLFSLSAFFVALAAGLLILHEGAQSSRWRQTIVVGCVWWAGVVLHGLYTLQAGVKRRFMRTWWGEREGFAPLAIDTFEEVSWYPKALADLLYQTFVAAYPVGPGFGRLQLSDPLPWLLTIIFVLAAIAAVRTHRAIFFVALGAILFTVVASAFRLYPFSSRVIIFLTPAVLLILAAGVDELNRKAGVIAAGLSSVALLAMAGLTAAKIALYPASISDMRGALELARGRFEAGDAVIAGRLNGSLLRFYRRNRIPAHIPTFNISLQEDADLVVDIARKHGFRRVWFVAAQSVADADQIIAQTERVAPVAFRWNGMWTRLALFDFSAAAASGASRREPSDGGRREAGPTEDEGSQEQSEPAATR
jgi:hypothetical protein